MSFWHDATGLDPKRQYRWVLYNDHIPLYTLKKVNKPSFTVSESTHKYLNHTYYYPGRVEWEKISMTLADPVQPDAAATITNIIKNSGYTPAVTSDDLQTMSKEFSVAALGQVSIQQIDSEGNAVETWTLWNAFVTAVKYGDLDYEGDEMTDVEIELRYDYAYLETTGLSTQGENSFWDPGTSP
jgi:hypothetical protein